MTSSQIVLDLTEMPGPSALIKLRFPTGSGESVVVEAKRAGNQQRLKCLLPIPSIAENPDDLMAFAAR